MTTTDHHVRLTRAIDSIQTLAERADLNAIARSLDHVAAAGRLDTSTCQFLHHARALLLDTVQALTGVLGTSGSTGEHVGRQCEESAVHQIGRCCRDDLTSATGSSVAIDAAEAWRRARLRLPGHDEDPVLIHIREFQDGYQAIPIAVAIPTPPPVPTIETPSTLVIDKATGMVTRWPLLPLEVLVRQYRRYHNQEPMTFSEPLRSAGRTESAHCSPY